MTRNDILWREPDPVEPAEIRRLLDDALGPEPAMRMDPDALLQRALRRERRIRIASMSGAVAAVATVTLGLALVTSSPALEDGPATPSRLVPGASVEQEPSSSSPPSTSTPSPSGGHSKHQVRTTPHVSRTYAVSPPPSRDERPRSVQRVPDIDEQPIEQPPMAP
ncbi:MULTISPECIES: hypothetical protein [Thermocrispum]|jgi:hypothetical protein|uniref:Uncharacterized protein n=1 Tax=Thermocrispum agreste TaxID=37925 RepID=A0A2W4JR11_9PSEU|nr:MULTISPECIES: hypothetical protein [Thermocrispum]PZN00779.1 MAG: hypothetical protein DIU77_02705 [Thermocrispum agreste]